jgi:hypothetical protein
MNVKLYPFFFLVMALFLSSCSPKAKLASSWIEPTMQGYKAQNVLVLAVSRNEPRLKLWEVVFVDQLADHGVDAMAGSRVVGTMIQPDRTSVEAAVDKSGAQSVLITRVIGVDSKTYTYPGRIHFMPGGYYTGMYGYYNTIYQVRYTQPVDKTKTEVLLESNLYDVATARLVWSAQSEMVNPKLLRTDFDKIVGVLIADMKKDGLLN